MLTLIFSGLMLVSLVSQFKDGREALPELLWDADQMRVALEQGVTVRDVERAHWKAVQRIDDRAELREFAARRWNHPAIRNWHESLEDYVAELYRIHDCA